VQHQGQLLPSHPATNFQEKGGKHFQVTLFQRKDNNTIRGNFYKKIVNYRIVAKI